ncbi:MULTISPECIES: hemerythrin domain-containing protein [Ensifer]|uniref:hemerythrin domain-containing protein n=1 Tax=Ensifer TaxID=106591 RepID=UPI00132ED847|nr:MULTISPECIES: hemerythrin domain-containing protein [Ensifer]MBD9543866.1 hemerythrin domain-containing protein [Ensifer sp. ENS04]QHG73223.1 hemerythrin domain-containing protein [Ensifer adhaerens]
MQQQFSENHELGQAYRELLSLCDRLETLADSIPRRIDLTSCRVILTELPEKLRRVHALEEMILFPAVEIQRADDGRYALIARLRAEHDQDDRAAVELVRVLKAVLDNRPSLSWDAIGYMLRGFFETVRRHVATERLLLWRHA